MEQTFTMMSEEEAPEVGPNDIVIHLVNPYKCGQCELEFLEKPVFKEHMFSHLEQVKEEHPSSQILMSITLSPETPGGVTVTRDILQLTEDGSIKQVLQLASNNITLNQVSPLRELEEAGVLKLERPKPLDPVITKSPMATAGKVAPTVGTGATASNFRDRISTLIPPNPTVVPATEGIAVVNSEGMESLVKADDGTEETEVSEIVDNKDGSFSVAFKGPNNEMQHIQILRPEGVKGDMMLELTNMPGRRRFSQLGSNKSNKCNICGKILSSSTNLIRHKMYHSTERPFVCDVCHKGFKDVSNLKKHTQIHKRIYPCYLCKKSFLRKSLLANHLQRHEARTTLVKTGSASREVNMRTFVDVDGTRVEEMSMVALKGQTFEYKHRIVKADTEEKNRNTQLDDMDSQDLVKSETEVGLEDSLTTDPTDEMEGNVSSQKAMFMVTASGLQETETQEVATAVGSTQTPTTAEVGTDKEEVNDADDLPDIKIIPPPEDFVKVYQCGHCSKRTVQRGNMMRHLIHHLKDKPFVCDECPKQFVDKGELVKHKKTHTKPYRCHQCNGAFAHNVQVIKHLQSECLGKEAKLHYTMLEDEKTYKCDICNIEMKRLGNMIKHVGTHSLGSKKFSWYKNSRNRKSKLMTSNFTQAQPESSKAAYYFDRDQRAFVCNICSKKFKQKVNIHRHVQIHTKESLHQSSDALLLSKPFKCDQCSAVFSRKLFLDSHKRRHNLKEPAEDTADYGALEDKSGYYCKHCNKQLTKKYRMMSHIRLHTNQRPYECEVCNKCFSCRYMLLKHRKSHASPFTCDKCGMTFSCKLFLNVHKKKVHFSDPAQPMLSGDVTFSDESEEKDFFLCSICNAPFSRLVIKMNHEKKCREETKVMIRLPMGKGFKCKICGKIATLKHNLMVHIRKHEDVVKVDSNGCITLVSDTWTDVEEEGSSNHSSSLSKSTAKKSKLSMSPKKSFSSKMKADIDSSDMDIPEDEESPVEEEDEKYKRTPGGWACMQCRRKFTDRDTILQHLESHIAPPDSTQDADGCTEESKTETVQNDMSQNSIKQETEAKLNGSPVSSKSHHDGDEDGSASSQQKEQEVKQKSTLSGESKKRKVKGRSSAVASPSTPDSIKDPKSMKQRAALFSKGTPTPNPVEKLKNSSMDAPSPSRSGNRPARTQKLPSRFLE